MFTALSLPRTADHYRLAFISQYQDRLKVETRKEVIEFLQITLKGLLHG